MAETDNAGAPGCATICPFFAAQLEMKSTYIYVGPDRVLATLYMRAPGSPLGPGNRDLAEKHMKRALEIDPNWPENQLGMAELEFGLAKKRDMPEFAEQARERLQKHFQSDDAKAPMGSGFEFARWQEDARGMLEADNHPGAAFNPFS